MHQPSWGQRTGEEESPDMMDMIMGGEEVGDLDPAGPVHILKGAEVPDLMTAPQSFLLPRPSCLHRHKLWKY